LLNRGGKKGLGMPRCFCAFVDLWTEWGNIKSVHWRTLPGEPTEKESSKEKKRPLGPCRKRRGKLGQTYIASLERGWARKSMVLRNHNLCDLKKIKKMLTYTSIIG